MKRQRSKWLSIGLCLCLCLLVSLANAQDQARVYRGLTLLTDLPDRQADQFVRLRLQGSELTLETSNGKKVLVTLRYDELQKIEYQRITKRRNPANLTLGTMVVVGSGAIGAAAGERKSKPLGILGIAGMIGGFALMVKGMPSPFDEKRLLLLHTPTQIITLRIEPSANLEVVEALEFRTKKPLVTSQREIP